MFDRCSVTAATAVLANSIMTGVDTCTLIVLIVNQYINQSTLPALMSPKDRKCKFIDWLEDVGLPDSAVSLSGWVSGLGLFSGVQPAHMFTGPLMVFCTSLCPPRKTTSMLKGSMAVSWRMATLDLAAAVLGS